MHINTILIFLMHKAHENFCQILMCHTFAHEAEIDFMCTLVYRMVDGGPMCRRKFRGTRNVHAMKYDRKLLFRLLPLIPLSIYNINRYKL